MGVMERISEGVDRLLGRKDAEIRKYMREVKRNLEDLKSRDRKQILSEIRSHIDEKFAEALKENPDKDRTVLVHEVLNEFGEPAQIAKAYMPAGLVPQKGAAAVKVAKIIATSIVVMFVFGMVMNGIVSCVYGPSHAELMKEYYKEHFNYLNNQNEPRKQIYTARVEVYSHIEQNYPQPKTSALPIEENFYLPVNTTRIELTFTSQGYQTNVPIASSVRIQVTNPNGDAVFDKTFSGPGTEVVSVTCNPVTGDWKVAYTYVSYTGYLVVGGTAYVEQVYYY